MKYYFLCFAILFGISNLCGAQTFDNEKLFNLFIKAEQGDKVGQNIVGAIYELGLPNLPQDYSEALKWYKLSALQGYADAEFSVGHFYADGLGVNIDRKEAIRWWKLSASHGSSRAQHNLGVSYKDGEGVSKDYSVAMNYFKLAAAQGEVRAYLNIALMYVEGQGVPQSYHEAKYWWRLAAEQGDSVGQSMLAIMYEAGQDVAKDYIRAHMWWNLASMNGDEEAKKNREALAIKMTAQQITQAQKLAAVCIANNFKKCE